MAQAAAVAQVLSLAQELPNDSDRAKKKKKKFSLQETLINITVIYGGNDSDFWMGRGEPSAGLESSIS